MNLKPSQSPAPLTQSGLTPSVTGLALQRIAAGPDPRKFVIAGGKIQGSMPEDDLENVTAPKFTPPKFDLESADPDPDPDDSNNEHSEGDSN